MGFSTALFLVFLILKLTDTIDWSWWWVFAPLIVDGVLFALAVAVGIALELSDRD
ncbi:hypothetical protein ACWEQ4_01115 [Rhodococcus sp. NPDC003994]